MNAPVYVNQDGDIDQGIHKVKLKNALPKWKTTWVFFFYKYGKFWSISPDKKVYLFFSEEWYTLKEFIKWFNLILRMW